jgi:dynein regulatory complex subunit 2
VDAKDAILQMLDRDLDEAEEQYQMALRNHLIHIEDLIKLQESRLAGLHEEFERNVNIIKKEFDTEKSEIMRSHEMETLELREMIATITEEENAKVKQMQNSFETTREETKNTDVENLESMKHELIKQIEQLDSRFEVEFNRYSSETDARVGEYKNLLDKNEQNSKQIKAHAHRIHRLKEQITYWQVKQQQSLYESKIRNDQLMKERMSIRMHYDNLKAKMTRQRDDKEKHLGQLSLNALNCIETLKGY